MKRYAIINSENIVSNIAIADNPLDIDGVWVDLTDLNPEPGIGWSYFNGQFNLPPAPPPLPNIISKLAMINRFTDSEFVGILAASKTDPEVEAWKIKLDLATEINLDDLRTQSGFTMLVNKGLLTELRANEILGL